MVIKLSIFWRDEFSKLSHISMISCSETQIKIQTIKSSIRIPAIHSVWRRHCRFWFHHHQLDEQHKGPMIDTKIIYMGKINYWILAPKDMVGPFKFWRWLIKNSSFLACLVLSALPMCVYVASICICNCNCYLYLCLCLCVVRSRGGSVLRMFRPLSLSTGAAASTRPLG